MSQPANRVDGFRNILLLGPARMPQAIEWRQFLAEAAGSCVLATLHDADLSPADRSSVVTLSRGATWSLGRLPSSWRKARALVASGEFDLIVAYYLTSYGLMAASIAPGRYIAVPAGSDIAPIRVKVPRLAAARIAVRRAMGTMAWTEPMAEILRKLGADPRKLLILPRGIDLELFQKPVEAKRPSGIVRIVSTRRLRPLFRIDRLIGAMGKLRTAGVPAHLNIVGDGTERSSLEDLVRRSGLEDQITFAGGLERPLVANHLKKSDVFVSLSRSDGLSTSLVEALACGLFPVVSDIPSNREVVEHGRNGLLVDGDNPDDIAAALLMAASNRDLREHANRLNSALVRERFDIRRNTQVFLETAARWRQNRAPAETQARPRTIETR
jgi:glycosyltransferase involved in cell wall biosynthesis